MWTVRRAQLFSGWNRTKRRKSGCGNWFPTPRIILDGNMQRNRFSKFLASKAQETHLSAIKDKDHCTMRRRLSVRSQFITSWWPQSFLEIAETRAKILNSKILEQNFRNLEIYEFENWEDKVLKYIYIKGKI